MAWYNASWSYRVKVSVKATAVTADILNFPIHVDLSDLPAGFHTHVKAGGVDIRVTKADGETEVPREVVFYDADTDTGELHFKGDILDETDVDFYIYYGNAGADDYAKDAEFGAENVWTNGFLMVHHLQEAAPTGGASNDHLDSTSNDLDGEISGGTDMTATGKIGLADSFDNINGYVATLFNPATHLGAGHAFTLEAWVKPVAVTAGSYDSVFYAAAGSTRFYFLVKADYDPFIGLGNGYWETSGIPLTQNVWNYYVTVYDGNNVYQYTNAGTPWSALNQGAKTFGSATSGIGGPIYPFNGPIDEVRISNVVRDGDWVQTTYNNQNSPATFYDVGTEEVPAVGGAVGMMTTRTKFWGDI